MLCFLYLILLSYSTGNSSTCSGDISLLLKLQRNTLYTYGNNVGVTRWPRNDRAKAKHLVNSFNTTMYPIARTSRGYTVYEVISDAQNSDLIEIVGKTPPRLPVTNERTFYPVGIIEGAASPDPVPLKKIPCNKIFKTTETSLSVDGELKISKTSINKIIDTKRIKMGKKKIELVRMESRTDVVLSGKMNGTGTEKSTVYIINGTRELYEEKRTFKYEYVNLESGKPVPEVISGEFQQKLIKKDKYYPPKIKFEQSSDEFIAVPYYTNKNGLFVSINLNSTTDTKMYVSPTSNSSFLEYQYFINNFPEKQKDKLFPIEKLTIGGTIINNPKMWIVRDPEIPLDYKIPGMIGKDIISHSTITLDDKKRMLSIYSKKEKEKTPSQALIFDLVEQIPIFEITVNGSKVRATVSFDTIEPEISTSLVQQLGLEVIKIAGSKDRPQENIIEKSEIIITPIDRPYFKTQAKIKDFSSEPYDLKLGLNYLKGKKLTINYRDSWLLIQDDSL
jgi:hypothetical protein